MKIVKLEQDRIKVILSESDLMNMNIDLADITPDSEELSDFLREIMETVRIETGFTMDNGQVIVEASTFANGIILMLSKVKRLPDKSKIKCIKAVKKNERATFEFESFDDLVGMFKNVRYEHLFSMRLFRYMHSFYITIPKNNIPLLMYEYSIKKLKSNIAENILSEYGTFLASGSRIVTMVAELKKMN